jgi:hypothetical protein
MKQRKKKRKEERKKSKSNKTRPGLGRAGQSRAEQRKDGISSIFTNLMMYNTQDTVCLTLSSLD